MLSRAILSTVLLATKGPLAAIVTTASPPAAQRIMHVTSYDQLPYPNRSHPTAHVRKLQAVATLFGMHPRSISQCRVLELGCASGWNLLPQAAEFPQSEFVGVELSPQQVAVGQELMTRLKFPNVTLHNANILDVDDSWGKYDYILCHGVYSWVPEQVRNKILEICRSNLTPQGVALVSYNVLPGWHFRGIIRDMMLFHVSQFKQPEERIEQARAVLDFMAKNCPENSAYGQMLRDEVDIVRNADDQYLYHDHLEDHNEAVYFHQFMGRAESHGLRYLGDTQVATMLPKNYSLHLDSALVNAPLTVQEQYMDFFRNTAFRTTLLCHHEIQLNRTIHRESLIPFQVSLASRLDTSTMYFNSDQPLTLKINSTTVSTSSPLAIALIQQLAINWPRPTNVDQLSGDVHRLLSANGDRKNHPVPSVSDVAGTLMDLFTGGVLDVCVEPPSVTNSISFQPLTTPLVRMQASLGKLVTNLRHENVQLDNICRQIATSLDARHDRSMIAEDLLKAITQGDLTIEPAIENRRLLNRHQVDAMVDTALKQLCHSAILVA